LRILAPLSTQRPTIHTEVDDVEEALGDQGVRAENGDAMRTQLDETEVSLEDGLPRRVAFHLKTQARAPKNAATQKMEIVAILVKMQAPVQHKAEGIFQSRTRLGNLVALPRKGTGAVAEEERTGAAVEDVEVPATWNHPKYPMRKLVILPSKTTGAERKDTELPET
jgi:hypothetical protein